MIALQKFFTNDRHVGARKAKYHGFVPTGTAEFEHPLFKEFAAVDDANPNYTANLGGFFADAGLRVLLLDLDMQPTLSSYYAITSRAECGIYELLAYNERDIARLASRTAMDGLDVVLSNDHHRQLATLLLNAPDGRLRLRNLLPAFEPHYDVVLVDTQGARSFLLEMAILASDIAVSPVTPEILAARELRRGIVLLLEDIVPFRQLAIESPPLKLLVNRLPAVSVNARLIQQSLHVIFREQKGIEIPQTEIPALEAFPRAATEGLAAHRIEYRRPSGRVAPAALDIMHDLAAELCPQWRDRFAGVAGRLRGRRTYARRS